MQALASEATAPFEVTSSPLGATVSVKSYDAPDDDWYELGVTPFTGAPATDQRGARRILDALRSRANQPDRPRFELDYIDRLLKGLY